MTMSNTTTRHMMNAALNRLRETKGYQAVADLLEKFGEVSVNAIPDSVADQIIAACPSPTNRGTIVCKADDTPGASAGDKLTTHALAMNQKNPLNNPNQKTGEEIKDILGEGGAENFNELSRELMARRNKAAAR